METSVELRQLRYFVAVAEELHFGRAAERLHMSQSPLSRAIRDLERELGIVLFVRTTRRVELTPAGSLLLERSRRALAEIDAAIADARRTSLPDEGVLALGHGPFSRPVVVAIGDELARRDAELALRLEEGVTPEMLARVARHELAAAVVMESPAAARQHGVRIEALRDEPLLAALPESHPFAHAEAIPLAAFVAEVVMLPTEPPGQLFNSWFRTVVRAAGFELDRTVKTNERAVGPTHVAGRERRSRLAVRRRMGERGIRGGRGAVRSAAELPDGSCLVLAAERRGHGAR